MKFTKDLAASLTQEHIPSMKFQKSTNRTTALHLALLLYKDCRIKKTRRSVTINIVSYHPGIQISVPKVNKIYMFVTYIEILQRLDVKQSGFKVRMRAHNLGTSWAPVLYFISILNL